MSVATSCTCGGPGAAKVTGTGNWETMIRFVLSFTTADGAKVMTWPAVR